MNHTIDYYNKNAQGFYERTVNADVKDVYDAFLPYVLQGGKILDVGCGIGRDSKFFKEHGYNVTAFDGSEEMVRMASEHVGGEVLHLFYKDIDFEKEFDGIWACASLIHVPYNEFESILVKLHSSLKDTGVFYASFKYGDHKRSIEGRDFYDFDEESIMPYLGGLFTPIRIWQTEDLRSRVAPSAQKAWLNVLCKKA